MTTTPSESPFWSRTPSELAQSLSASLDGLSNSDAARRQSVNRQVESSAIRPWRSLLLQFTNPIQLLLIGAAILSGSFGEYTDAAVIVVILLAGGLLSFQHEFRAGNAVAELMKLVETKCKVVRQGSEQEVSLKEVVPGDILLLSAGSMIPGDGLLISSDTLFVDQAALTGESFPVEKQAGTVDADASIEKRTNCVFAGSHVVSGSARVLIARTGSETELGGIAGSLKNKRPEGDFERGIRHLGMMLIQLTIFLTLLVFAVNVSLHRPVLESFMFSLALAVGLTPQLLPAIVSVNLSRGAVAMAKDSVIVKRLASIENFGAMDVLCSDKTGTLTEGSVRVAKALNALGEDAPTVLNLCHVNALLESGYANPIDEALRLDAADNTLSGIEKLGELPYDFERKRLTVFIGQEGRRRLITKGALEAVLACCTKVATASDQVDVAPLKDKILASFQSYSEDGYRVLGVATRELDDSASVLDTAAESEMTFEGFLLLEDPLRPESAATVRHLAKLGIRLKMITGDNRHVAKRLGEQLGLTSGVLSGPEIRNLSEAALRVQASKCSVFAEIEPNQKEHIVLALKRAGGVVGYIGDGINDGAALHAADVSISVANAVDVAKEAADFVMLKPDLSVLIGAVAEGRRTFTNTMKYVYMATSANFGNMFSLAGASLLVPFLPLLPKQVLLTNLLTDMPEMTIATDNVDSEMLEHRQKWDIRFLFRFMLVFGLLSSVFDFSTFGVLLWLKASPDVFRTGWFTESVLSASLVVLVFRSRRWIWRSRASSALLMTTALTGLAVLVIPYTPLAPMLGFTPLSLPQLGLMLGIVVAYVASAELAKHLFFQLHAQRVRHARHARVRPHG